ncbi:MAG: serine/threonine protein kinase [Deltaproteobacteria bacterium]|nr:serine/threonine protein kinase [Deltaproteobacteria bacterium]
MRDTIQFCSKCLIPLAKNALICPVCGTGIDEFSSRSIKSLEGLHIDNNYVLEEFISSGSMSQVYRAVHKNLGSSVAIKILKPDFLKNDDVTARFKQEAKIMGSLNHPNIMSVITSGETPGGFQYIISEYLKGPTLEQLLVDDVPLPLTRAVSIIRQLLSALSEAHAWGFIHRDLKPSNIIIIPLRGGGDIVKLVDFGISTVFWKVGKRITGEGELIGSPEYMSPEVINGERPTVQSDIYSLGVMFYRMISGYMPFKGENAWEILNSHIKEIPPRPSSLNSALSDVFDVLLLNALEKNPVHRIRNTRQFEDLLTDAFSNLKLGTVEATEFSIQPQGSKELSIETLTRPGSRRQSRTLQLKAVDTSTIPDIKNYKYEKLSIPYELSPKIQGQIIHFMSGEETSLNFYGPEGSGRGKLLSRIPSMDYFDGVRTIIISFDKSLTQRPWYPVVRLIEKLSEIPSDLLYEEKILYLEQWLDQSNVSREDSRYITGVFSGTFYERPMERAVRLREVMASLLQMIFSVSAIKPLLLVFEGFERYDNPTKTFVEYIAKRSHGKSIKILMSCDKEIRFSMNIPMEKIDENIRRLYALKILTGKSDSIHSHLESIIKFKSTSQLYIDEAIRYLIEGGTHLPDNPADIIKYRLNAIGSDSLRILQLLSVNGMCASIDMIWAYVGKTSASAAALGSCIKRNFIIVENDEVYISHPITAKVIYSTTPKNIKDSLNLFSLDYMLKNSGDIFVLSQQYVIANDMENSIEYLKKAAERSESLLDDSGAIRLFQKAHDLSQVDTLGGKNPAVLVEICCRLGDLLMYTGDFTTAERVFREGLLFSDGLLDFEVSMLSSMARMTSISTKTEEKARTLIGQALKKAESTKNPEMMFKAYFDFSFMELKWEKWEEGARILREGIESIRKSNSSPEKYWRLYLRLSEFEFALGNHSRAIEILMSSLAVNKNFYSFLATGRIHYQIGVFFLKMDQVQDAKIHFSLAIDLLAATGDRMGVAQASLAMAQVHPKKERSPFIRKALSLSEQIGWEAGLEKASRLALGA